MDVRIHRSQRVRATRGTLAYCLESVDNPGIDIFLVQLRPETVEAVFSKAHFGGVTIPTAQSTAGDPITFIPYFLCGNRGPSQMTVYVRLA